MSQRKVEVVLFAVLLGASTLCARAEAAQCASGAQPEYEQHVLVTHLPFTPFGPPLDVLLPAWDPTPHPAGSHLVGLRLEVHLDIYATFRVENLNASTCYIGWTASQELELTADPALGDVPDSVHALVGSHASLQAFDGSLDYSGPSGRSWFDETHGNSAPIYVEDDPAILQAWATGGEHALGIWGVGVLAGSSPCTLQVEHLAASVLTITVEYTWCGPDLGDPYCFGDGSGAPCPCGNSGPPASGCANSSGLGARLLADGSTSVSVDDLVVHGSGLVPGQPALLYAGTSAPNGGAGVPFGDGLRCAGGDVRRLGIELADFAGTTLHGPGLAAFGSLPAGETRGFQLWYRDNAGPCASGFNLSYGIAIALTP